RACFASGANRQRAASAKAERVLQARRIDNARRARRPSEFCKRDESTTRGERESRARFASATNRQRAARAKAERVLQAARIDNARRARRPSEFCKRDESTTRGECEGRASFAS